MKITEGFVAVLPDGQFLYIGATRGHGGDKIYTAPVIDIEQATVRNYPNAKDRDEREALEPLGVKWVAVQVRREVILRSYGT